MKFRSGLSQESRRRLDAQLEALPWDELDDLIERYVVNRPVTHIPGDLAPAPYFPLKPADREMAAYYERARAEAEKLLRAGKVSLLTVAGGQVPARYDGPKGPSITPVKIKPCFNISPKSTARPKYGVEFTWYIMTSERTTARPSNFKDNDFG